MDPQCNNHRLYVKGLTSSDVKVNVQENDGDPWGNRQPALLSARLADQPLRPFARKTASRFSVRSKPSQVRFRVGIIKLGDPWGNRTPVTGVRGRCLNRLTNGPHFPTGSSVLLVHHQGLEPGTH